jgi:fatty-acyl-CoA synthase
MLTGHADFLEQWARVAPFRVALVDAGSGRSLTYEALSRRVWRLCHALAAMGVGHGDRVALLARNDLSAFEVLLACLRTGAVYTPLNWRLAAPELAGVAQHCGPRVLFHDAPCGGAAQALREAAPDLRLVAAGEPYEALLAAGSDRPDPRARDPEALAMLLYTSGTTGRPKGVMVPHRQLFWNAVNTVYACDLGPGDRALACLPLFHTGGLNCVSTPTLYRGGTVVLMDAFDAERALDVITSRRVTLTVAVPTMYQMLLDAGAGERDLTSLATLLCGGAPCPDALLDEWLDRGFNFRQGFGMTEVGPNCFSLPPWMTRRKRGSVGLPVLHGAARVVREDASLAEPGEVGELQLAGPHVSQGYYRDEEATRALFDGEWLRTGDLARTDAEGYYHIAGRRKDMFISGGENVYPAEIENVVLAFDGVAEVAVVGVPDPRWGESGAAVVVARAGCALEVEALREHCRAHLARFKVPGRFDVVEALPKNSSGKVLKQALRERLAGERDEVP